MTFFIVPADIEAIAELAVMGTGDGVTTNPSQVIKQLVQHPLTDKGQAAFLADWNELQGR